MMTEKIYLNKKECDATYLPPRQKEILKTLIEQRELGVHELSRLDIMRLQEKGNCSYALVRMTESGTLIITKRVNQLYYYSLNPTLTDGKIEELLNSVYTMSEDYMIKKSRKKVVLKRSGKSYDGRRYENVDNKVLMHELIGSAYQPSREVIFSNATSFTRPVTG